MITLSDVWFVKTDSGPETWAARDLGDPVSAEDGHEELRYQPEIW